MCAATTVVQAVDRCPRLEEHSEGLSRLKLHVTCYAKAEETLAALRSSQHLRELSLSGPLGDAEVGRLVTEVLLHNRSLQRLNLELRECSDRGAEHLAKLIHESPNVRFLTLMLNNVTAEGARELAVALAGAPLLSFSLYASQLDLHDRCVGDEGARHFAEALRTSRSLTSFTIAQSGISNRGLEHLLQAQGESRTLTSLNLHSNRVDSDGAAAISRSLATAGCPLKQLILNENHCLGNEGARELALALCHNSALEVLSLRSCGIGEEGGRRFATPLSRTNTLRVLNLCGNVALGDGGVEMIARGLKSNGSLQQLDLSSCGVTDEGCDHLADALCSNASLTHLLLHRNGISNGGAVALGKALTVNSFLTTLVLSENPVEEKGVSALGQALEHNTSLTSLVLGQAVLSSDGSPQLVRAGTTPRAQPGRERHGSHQILEGRSPRMGAGKGTKVVGEEGGSRGMLVAAAQLRMVGGGQGLAVGLVEALVSKNRKLASYKKRVKELKERVRELEELVASKTCTAPTTMQL